MFIMPSFKKSLIVEQFQGNYLKLSFYGLWLSTHFRARIRCCLGVNTHLQRLAFSLCFLYYCFRFFGIFFVNESSMDCMAWLAFYTHVARYTVCTSILNIIDHKNYYIDDLL